MKYECLTTRRTGAIEYLSLNRPAVRNAFDPRMVAELTRWSAALADAATRHEVRVAVIGGAGAVFCAGADAAWMSRTAAHTKADNLSDARALAGMYAALDALPLPILGRVHGAAIGGGAGLAAVCDIVVAEESAVFAFSEVRLGILPAVISPFVLAKIGSSAARELFLTGARFSAARAREIGLVHHVVPASALDSTVAAIVSDVLASGPEAIAAAKRLIRDVSGHSPADAFETTTTGIAERRVSHEGQEGLRAFLEKRKPSWAE